MAKLSARGRSEIWRVEERRTMEDGRPVVETTCLMSDGCKLTKLKIGSHDYGWKNAGMLRGFRGQERRLLDSYVKAFGCTIVHSTV